MNDGSLSSEAPQNHRMQLMKGEKIRESKRETEIDREGEKEIDRE